MTGKPTYEELEQENRELKALINESRQIKAALEESEASYRAVAEDTPVFICRFLPGGEISYVNKAYCDYFVESREALIGKKFLDLIPETDRESVMANISSLSADFPTLTHEHRVIAANGEIRWQKWTNRALSNSQGKIVAYQSIGEDITDRKRADEALRQSEERLRLVLEATNEGLWDWDLIGEKLILSDKFKDLIGFQGEDSHIKIDDWTEHIHPAHRESVMKMMQEHLEQKGPYNIDYLYRRMNDPEYRWHNVRGKAFFNKKGKAYRMVGSIQDINDRKKGDELIRKLTRQLINAQEIEYQKISHELHDIVAQDLSTLRIHIKSLLKYKSLTAGVIKKLSEISDGLHKTLITVRDISYYLRPSGLNELGLARTLYQFCRDFSEKTGVQVDFQAAGMEKLDINYDTKINIYRLVQEGLNNVRKHADANKVAVKLVSSFPNIILRIEDDGKGFDVTQRLSKAAGEKRMGLRSMEERVAFLHGKMNIESIPGKGTKIVMKILYKDEEKTSAASSGRSLPA